MTSQLILTEGTAPGSPSTNKHTLYVDSADSKLKMKDGAGAVTEYTEVADASETVKGIVKRASDAEAAAGIDTEKFVTPAQIATVVGGYDTVNDVLFSQVSAVETASTSYTKLITYTMLKSGTINLKFDLLAYTYSGSNTASCYVAVNGHQMDVVSSVYTNGGRKEKRGQYRVGFSVKAGDTVEMRVKRSGSDGSDKSRIENFYILGR